MSEEAARLWGVIGTWFSGIGSMLAVIVSLYLARRQDRVNLTVSAGIRQLVTPGERGAPPKFVAIRVVNRGYRRVTVSHVGWRIGLLRKRNFVQLLHPRHPMSSDIPVSLDQGEQANFFIPLDGESIWL